jgi:hypothetical protein
MMYDSNISIGFNVGIRGVDALLPERGVPHISIVRCHCSIHACRYHFSIVGMAAT